MNFLDFAASHGLIIENLIEGRWARVKTDDKPKKRNGSYKFLGDVGFVQNHATMDQVAMWKEGARAGFIDKAAIRARIALDAAAEKARHDEARAKAEDMLKRAVISAHPYLAAKGFPDERGLVLDDQLLIPMREFKFYKQVNSLQRIAPDGSKLFLPGGKAKSSVFFIGPRTAAELWFCEGFVDGLTLKLALTKLYRTARVVVCFSAANLTHVAKLCGTGFVYADNDKSQTGQHAAEATGLLWTMSDIAGNDVNDDYLGRGIGYVCEKMRSLSAKATA